MSYGSRREKKAAIRFFLPKKTTFLSQLSIGVVALYRQSPIFILNVN